MFDDRSANFIFYIFIQGVGLVASTVMYLFYDLILPSASLSQFLMLSMHSCCILVSLMLLNIQHIERIEYFYLANPQCFLLLTLSILLANEFVEQSLESGSRCSFELHCFMSCVGYIFNFITPLGQQETKNKLKHIIHSK
jgi:hypothetical protein